MCEQLDLGGVVLEGSRNDLAVEFVVAISPQPKRSLDRVEEPAHIPALAADIEDLSAWIEIRLSFFDEWYSVVRLVVREAAPEIAVVGCIPEAGFGESRAIEGIRNREIDDVMTVPRPRPR
jgi:hypothetical protein